MAKDVTLILNGHTITGTGGPASVGIEAGGSGDTILGPGTVSGTKIGIDLAPGSGSVRGVTVTKNALGIGIFRAGNSVRGNVAKDNIDGIVAGASGNTIIGNYAHGNTSDDLIDNSGTCTSNVWLGNDFGTASPSCIR
jgi:parallel beta-helix repeat protein